MLRALRRLQHAPRVAVIEMNGSVAKGNHSRALNLWRYKPALDRAFKSRNLKAVALNINSPGGSAVQSSLLAKYIKQLQAKHKNVPVLAFCEDVCLSGGYYIATAADEIYADRSSLVGSIGVFFGSLGFSELLKNAGVERRVITSGEFKSIMDPFAPAKDSDERRLTHVLYGIHDNFVDVVKKSRGEKLNYEVANKKAKAAKPDLPDSPNNGLFDGSFYEGQAAVDVGFEDAIGDMHSHLKERFGEDVILREFRPRGQFPFVSSIGASLGGSLAQSLVTELQAEELWSRYSQK